MSSIVRPTDRNGKPAECRNCGHYVAKDRNCIIQKADAAPDFWCVAYMDEPIDPRDSEVTLVDCLGNLNAPHSRDIATGERIINEVNYREFCKRALSAQQELYELRARIAGLEK